MVSTAVVTFASTPVLTCRPYECVVEYKKKGSKSPSRRPARTFLRANEPDDCIVEPPKYPNKLQDLVLATYPPSFIIYDFLRALECPLQFSPRDPNTTLQDQCDFLLKRSQPVFDTFSEDRTTFHHILYDVHKMWYLANSDTGLKQV